MRAGPSGRPERAAGLSATEEVRAEGWSRGQSCAGSQGSVLPGAARPAVLVRGRLSAAWALRTETAGPEVWSPERWLPWRPSPPGVCLSFSAYVILSLSFLSLPVSSPTSLLPPLPPAPHQSPVPLKPGHLWRA